MERLPKLVRPVTVPSCCSSMWAATILPGQPGESIKTACRALEVVVRGMGAQALFSILGKGRAVRILHVNTCLMSDLVRRAFN